MAYKANSLPYVAVMLLVLSIALATGRAHAGTVTIRTLSDNSDGDTSSITALVGAPGLDGAISLREAIAAANNTPGPDTVNVAVGGVIQPDNPLPTLSDTTGGTRITGDITLDGRSLAQNTNGITITSANNEVNGLTIVRFVSSGILITGGGADGNTVVGCNIGTDGSLQLGNFVGVRIDEGAQNNVIGSPDGSAQNLIGGNDFAGIKILGAETAENQIDGNTIGGLVGNQYGVFIELGASGNQVGSASGVGNEITNNTYGVVVDGADCIHNSIRRNRIHDNFLTEVQLRHAANEGMMSPTVTSLTPLSGFAPPNSTIDVFTDDGSAGETLVATATALADGTWNVLTPIAVTPGLNGTAIATSPAGSSSSFSDAVPFFGTITPLPLDNCPLDSMFSQAPDMGGMTTLYYSSDGALTLLERVEGLDRPMGGLVWWGNDTISGSVTLCDRTQRQFTIRVLQDTFGEPGRELAEYHVLARVVPSGLTYGVSAKPVYRYDADLDPPVAAARAWIEISGPPDGTCVFQWLATIGRDGLSRTHLGDDFSVLNEDLSLCVLPATLQADPRACLPDALHAQPMFAVGAASFGLYSSNERIAPAPPLIAMEHYAGVTTPIRQFAWWATTRDLDETFTPQPCLRDPDEYDLVFYSDDNGEPGVELRHYSITPARFDTGITMEAGAPASTVYRYEATLPEDPGLDTAWVGVYGTGEVECFMQWITSETGNGAAWQFQNGSTTPVPFDLAFCLGEGPPGGEVASEGEGEGEGETCLEACGEDSPDADGDGLTACQEACYGTDDALLDSDGDGMPENFEVLFGLDPAADDANEDPDGDALTNLEEFFRRSSPVDAGSPARIFYVSTDGVDAPVGGGINAPWATLEFALAQSDSTEADPARVVVAPGMYPEDITLRPGLELVGTGDVIIAGRVVGANVTRIENLEIQDTREGSVLLDLNNVAVIVSQVTFRGDEARTSTGMLLDGEAHMNSEIERCTFTRLSVGLDIADSIPRIRRCFFEDLAAAGVIVRPTEAATPNRTLGDITDTKCGWNTFVLATIDGPAVINQRGEALLMQQNDWGTDIVEEIDNAIQGEAIFEPFRASGSALLAAALYCTVWDAGSRLPVMNATLDLQVSSYTELVENVAGLYTYPALLDGRYTLTLSAPGYEETSVDVNIAPSETQSIIIPLLPIGVEGEGEGEGEGERPACCRRPRGDVRLSDLLGDLSIVVMLGAGILFARRNEA